MDVDPQPSGSVASSSGGGRLRWDVLDATLQDLLAAGVGSRLDVRLLGSCAEAARGIIEVRRESALEVANKLLATFERQVRRDCGDEAWARLRDVPSGADHGDVLASTLAEVVSSGDMDAAASRARAPTDETDRLTQPTFPFHATTARRDLAVRGPDGCARARGVGGDAHAVVPPPRRRGATRPLRRPQLQRRRRGEPPTSPTAPYNVI